MSLRAKKKDGYHESQSAVASKTNALQISKGTHNFMGKEAGAKVSSMANERNSRENVTKLRILSKQANIKLGRNWYRKPDSWIDNKILEIIHQFYCHTQDI